ncbi:MAG: alpha/beta fold hydrolase [Nitrospiraceae bacterium]
MTPFELTGADGKLICGDRLEGTGRRILFITGFLSKRWGNKSKALAQWCQEKGWGFCCYDVRGFGDSEGTFTDYTLSDWIDDARAVVKSLGVSATSAAAIVEVTHPPRTSLHPPTHSLPSQAFSTEDAALPGLTIVGNSLGSWIGWLMAQEFEMVEELILIAPAFNMMAERAKQITPERRHAWHTAGWLPWDDDALHKDWPLSWKWVEESEEYWGRTFSQLRRVKTTILHGLQDTVIQPAGSWRFVEEVLRRDRDFPIELLLKTGDHRLSSPEHVETLRRIVHREA